jgi:glycosyltransferase involved in cell wall biosynthesis
MHEEISVIIPSYNCSAFVGEAIESVIRQSDVQVSEIVVVDDGSEDETQNVVAKFPSVRYVDQEHAGASAARNRGVAFTHGDLIAFLDADDIWLPNKLSLQLSALRNDPSLDMMFGHVEEFKSPQAAFDESKLRRYAPGYVPGTLLVRRRAYETVGDFNCSWKLGEFVDWYIRAKELKLKSNLLPEVLLRRRIHGDNVGIRERQSVGDYARILWAALERRKTLVAD